MVESIGSSKKRLQSVGTTPPSPAKAEPVVATKSPSGAKPLAAPRSDSFGKAAPSTTKSQRRLAGTGKKADRKSFSSGATKARRARPDAQEARAGGAAASTRKGGAGRNGGAAANAGAAPQRSPAQIARLLSSKPSGASAHEATGILSSLHDGKDLGTAIGGLKGQALQNLLRESPQQSRSGLVEHVAQHGDTRARETLSHGIQSEIDRIQREGTDWIKHPVSIPSHPSISGPGAENHGPPGHGKNGGIEIGHRNHEIRMLCSKSQSGGGDGGRGPIG